RFVSAYSWTTSENVISLKSPASAIRTLYFRALQIFASSNNQWCTANRRVEELDWMERLQVDAPLAEEHLELQCTSGIGAYQNFRRRGEDVLDLAHPDLARALRLDEVIYARAAAALIAVGQLADRQTRYPGEQGARLRTHPLRVREMAGVVIDDL